jgi:zinc D-Ala-D-Ala dipeptidase
MKYLLSITLSCLAWAAPAAAAPGREVKAERPSSFVDVTSLEPSIQVEMMYFGSDNFVGRPISGYKENRCLLARPAAEALAKAQGRLRKAARRLSKDYVLSVRDCYRPHKATRDFLAWSEDPADTKQKDKFYPTLTKPEILSEGYLSSFSGHSRGSTVDLTIAERGNGGAYVPVDMGAIVDFFGEISHPDYDEIGKAAKENRRLLAKVMAPEFHGYDKEWWHFTYKPEPYPRTAFDFDVEEGTK